MDTGRKRYAFMAELLIEHNGAAAVLRADQPLTSPYRFADFGSSARICA